MLSEKLEEHKLKFIEKARKVHGDKYDYSMIEYKGVKEKVCIICSEHGEFWQNPSSHLSGCGCPKCSSGSKYTLDDFIKRAKAIHGDKYNYSKAEYKDNITKVCIICPEHGEFWQAPNNHLNQHQGCPKCSLINRAKKRASTAEHFIKKGREVHGDKYDYSKVEYVNTHTKVCIICSEHGEFWQRPHDHLSGYGCPKCCNRNTKYTTKEWIQKAKEVHGDKYDYSKVEYNGKETKVCIICPEHGEFWQTPHNHLSGQNCPNCRVWKLEDDIRDLLIENNIQFIRERKIGKEDNNHRCLRLDFYLPEYNIAIECQGGQHFIPVDFDGKGKKWAEKQLQKIKERDLRKKEYCDNNNIKIIYYMEDNKYATYNVITDKNKILNLIKNETRQ